MGLLKLKKRIASLDNALKKVCLPKVKFGASLKFTDLCVPDFGTS